MIKLYWTEDGDIDIDKMASQLWYDSNKLSGVGELKTLLGNLCKEVWTDAFAHGFSSSTNDAVYTNPYLRDGE